MQTIYRYILVRPDGEVPDASFETLDQARRAAKKLIDKLEYVEIYHAQFTRTGPADFQDCIRRDGSV